MTRIERPRDVTDAFAGDLAADSRERAVGALLKIPQLRKLWSAQLTGGIADRLGMLVLIWLTVQAAVLDGSFGGGYRGASFAVAAVLGARLVSTLLFGAVLLGPLSALTSTAGVLDRRWTMIGADGVRLALFLVAPLWITWVPSSAVVWLLVTAFAAGIAERLWTVARDGAAPGLLPVPTPGDTAVRPAPDHLATLHRLDLRTGFVALPVAAAALLVVTLLNSLLALGVDWFDLHQVALSSYVAAGLFSASIAVLYFLELPDTTTVRPHSPLEGLRLPKGPDGSERGRTGALPLLVLATAGVAGSIAAAVALSVLHALDLGFGPVGFGLLVLALTAGTVLGIRVGPRVLPALSRRRLLAIAIAVTGLALLLTGLVPDQTTVLLLAALAGTAAGVTANTGHVLIEQEAEEQRRARTTDHLHAVVRVAVAVAAIGAPLLAGLIGPHRLANGHFTFQHGGAAYTLMLIGALLLPVAALVLGKTDDRQGVPLRRDLREALRGGEPAAAPHATGFFIAIEGGDGAGKSTQVEALSEWIRAKGHEVVVTREPGATAVGKRLRSILLDVSSAGLSHRAEALLYAADRAEHVDSVVRPALERGAVVISDRYIDSSVAYQGAGRDLAPTEIARISRWATAGLVPNLTVLLDVSPEAARERFTEAPDRLESEPAEFHHRVRAGFLTLAAADPSRYLVIDAGQEPEAVTTVVRHRLDQALPLSQQEIEAREEARRQAEEAARIRAEEEAARLAEEARLEAERQAQLARLREEEAERQREIEEDARREAAEQEAEAARLRAEEAARLAEEERLRLAAEAAARAAEQDRLRRQAEEESKLRAEAEARRLEKQRKAEDALRRAEEARAAAAAATAAAAAAAGNTTQTVETPKPAPKAPDAETTVLPTVPKPPAAAADETAVLPAVPASPASAPKKRPAAPAPAVDETAVLPPVRPSAADETAVLPPVRPRSADRGPADRVPPSFFRPETPDNERTRELPAIDPDAAPPARRPRSDWAEETPLDDLPTLADELLGTHNDEDEGPTGPKRRR
ncbi:dTMP kinase [Streptomyces sp. H39-S7]|uniref:dTMP kinase n=1 Tax=Streptomyces sp. H39-S7 TaxID=3004357 RepID=UPI0022B044BB|nr:dTMP kinase [Streptomyces sp. H39-S7]MCZ4117791.1 dTMP kinase [Streptomyces sp. H39-S7]